MIAQTEDVCLGGGSHPACDENLTDRHVQIAGELSCETPLERGQHLRGACVLSRREQFQAAYLFLSAQLIGMITTCWCTSKDPVDIDLTARYKPGSRTVSDVEVSDSSVEFTPA